MLQEISYFMILGKPFIMYLGIIVLTLFIITASLGILILKGKNVKMTWHKAVAAAAIALGISHAILGVLYFF